MPLSKELIEQINHLEDLSKCKSCKLLHNDEDGEECGNCYVFYCNECLFGNLDLGYTEQTMRKDGYCGKCMDNFDEEEGEEELGTYIGFEQQIQDLVIIDDDLEDSNDYLYSIDYPDTDDLLEEFFH